MTARAIQALRHTSQPYTLPDIDSSHTLAQGLLLSAFNSAVESNGPNSPFDLVSRQFATHTGFLQDSDYKETGIARQYNGTTDKSMFTVTGFASLGTVTFTAWVYWDAFANDDRPLLMYTADVAGANAFYCIPNGAGFGTGYSLVQRTAGGSINHAEFTRPSVGWHHICCRWELSSGLVPPALVIDGVQLTATGTGSGSAVTITNSQINFMFLKSGATNLFGKGRLAYVLMHNRQLQDFEIRMHRDNPEGIFRPIQRWGALITAMPIPSTGRYYIAC